MNKIKMHSEDLEALKGALDMPLFVRKCVSAEEDENGVVSLKDAQGNVLAQMPLDVYLELKNWRQ